ncbi:MAG: hydrogenase [Candidatus Kaiserbacteria bacterium]|nr:MAG: hydrogenase [Candidatus Kaiserbacteria bacterium]
MLSLLARIIKTGTVTEQAPQVGSTDIEVTGENLKRAITRLYGGRSLRIRHVDAGSSNAEEYEMTALGNAYHDSERFGLSFVASPRHADILTVSGPVTRNMEHALRTAYDMTPEPRMVIAVGDGACTGGIWAGSYAVVGAVEKVIPVDAKIFGDPPSPLQILKGLLAAIEKART